MKGNDVESNMPSRPWESSGLEVQGGASGHILDTKVLEADNISFMCSSTNTGSIVIRGKEVSVNATCKTGRENAVEWRCLTLFCHSKTIV